ncbi:MAG TPA: glycosyltransferase family 39 protein [bacterium]|nr:glycosyltransferase family 39 protein [bacterium]HQG58679.1 glycosyltransferase family 39 protein [bacterium]HQG78993.1 glycosyltransferase family 39 protein [bacterium]
MKNEVKNLDIVHKIIHVLELALLLFLIFISFFYKLGYENINVDQFLWYDRTEKFFKAISEGKFASTYQQYHPGVTLMYLIGLGRLVYQKFTGDYSSWADITYENFGTYNFYTKLFVVIFCLLIIFYSAFVIYKITSSRKMSLAFLFLLFLESYYVGLIRNLHMDGILSVLIFSSVLSYYYGARSKLLKYVIFSGILFGLGLLTKSPSIFILPFCGIIFLSLFIKRKEDRKWLVQKTVIWALIAGLVFFALFPAMWVVPLDTLRRIIYDGVLDTGVSGGFNHFVNGMRVRDPGFSFYFLVLKYRLTPVMQFLLIFFVIYSLYIFLSKKNNKLKQKEEIPGIVLLSFLFFLIYFAAFISLKKKTDRYMSPVYPFFAFIASYSFFKLEDLMEKGKKKFALLIFKVLVLVGIGYYSWNIITIKPYFMAYYNHLWGGIRKAKNQIYLNQGGIGVFEIAGYLHSLNLPENPKIAVSNERELSVVTKYHVTAPNPADRKSYDLIIVPLQKDGIYKNGRKTVKIFKIQGQSYWKVYSALDL